MTHDEIISDLNKYVMLVEEAGMPATAKMAAIIRAVVELHKPSEIPDWVPTEEKLICWCAHVYPCPTVRAIEKELG